MAKECICKAGGALVKARRAAEKLERLIDEAVSQMRAVCDGADNGIQHNMIGAAIIDLGKARMAAGYIASAHAEAAGVLDMCGEERPTDDEIVVFGGGAR